MNNKLYVFMKTYYIDKYYYTILNKYFRARISHHYRGLVEDNGTILNSHVTLVPQEKSSKTTI